MLDLATTVIASPTTVERASVWSRLSGPQGRQTSREIERELKFLIAPRAVKSIPKIERSPALIINQAYLSKSELPIVRAFLMARGIQIEDSQLAEAANIRIRRQCGSRTELYDLTIKSRRFGDDRIERGELKISLSEVEYKALLPLARGALQKVRVSHDGWVIHPVEGRQKLVAEIDLLVVAGRGISLHEGEFSDRHVRRAFNLAKLCTVDIEIADSQLVNAVRRGSHSFAFLTSPNAIEVTLQDRDIQRNIGWRKIALKGYGSRAQNIVATLLTR